MRIDGLRVCMFVLNARDRDPRVWREAEALAEAGARVDVFMLRRSGQPEVTEIAPRVAVIRPTSRFVTSRKPWVSGPGYRSLFQAARGEQYDVYHCHDGATLPLGVAFSRRRNAPLVYDAHEFFTDHAPAGSDESLVERMRRRYTPDYIWERLFIHRANLHITVTSRMARLLADRYRLPSEPVAVGNRSPYWEPTPEIRTRLRAEIGDGTGPAIVFLGSSRAPEYAFEGDRHRGLEVLIDALEHLPAAQLVIIGSAGEDYRHRVIERAGAHGAQGRVHFMGLRAYEDYLELASGGDVGVYLLHGQSVSYEVTEANRLFDLVMARLPVLVAAGTETGNIVATHGVGVVLSEVDPPAVAAAIERITTDGVERARLDERVEQAAHELSWEQASVGLIDAYGSLVARPR